MIKRLRVNGYKSLKDLEINFSEGVTVFAGPNAAGKSNIIDLIKLVAATATNPLIKAFEAQRGDPIEVFDLRERGNGKRRSFKVEMDVILSRETLDAVEKEIKAYRIERKLSWERSLRYCLSVGFNRETGKLTVKEEGLHPLAEDGVTIKKDREGRERYYIKTEGRKVLLKIEGQSLPKHFNLGMDRTVVQEPLYVPHHPHVWAFKEEMKRVLAYYLDPYEMRKESPIVETEIIEPTGEYLAAFMNTLKRSSPQAYANIKRDLGVFVEDITNVEAQRVPQTDKLILIFNESGIKVSSRIISEGTLRILAILALVNSPVKPATVAFEEPENGVHTARLEVLATIFKNAYEKNGIQFILTTHSPTLYRYFPLEGVHIVKKRGGYTQVISLVQALSFLGYKIDKVRARGIIGALLREDETLAGLIDSVVTQR